MIEFLWYFVALQRLQRHIMLFKIYVQVSSIFGSFTKLLPLNISKNINTFIFKSNWWLNKTQIAFHSNRIRLICTEKKCPRISFQQNKNVFVLYHISTAEISEYFHWLSQVLIGLFKNLSYFLINTTITLTF